MYFKTNKVQTFSGSYFSIIKAKEIKFSQNEVSSFFLYLVAELTIAMSGISKYCAKHYNTIAKNIFKEQE